jgi:hypothetical protein
MTQKFQFSGKAEILHLNARKEGPDDDKQLAVDVKLRAVTAMAINTRPAQGDLFGGAA